LTLNKAPTPLTWGICVFDKTMCAIREISKIKKVKAIFLSKKLGLTGGANRSTRSTFEP